MKLSRQFFQRMFFVSALWNFSASIPGMLFPELSMKLFFGAAMDTSLLLGNYYAYSMYLFWWGAVLLFGIGYYQVSRDIERNRGIVWMAIIGKLCFFAFFVASYCAGKATVLALLGGCGDFVFTVLFLIFLWQTRKEPVR
jgi:hypothetical protein